MRIFAHLSLTSLVRKHPLCKKSFYNRDHQQSIFATVSRNKSTLFQFYLSLFILQRLDITDKSETDTQFCQSKPQEQTRTLQAIGVGDGTRNSTSTVCAVSESWCQNVYNSDPNLKKRCSIISYTLLLAEFHQAITAYSFQLNQR